MTAVAGEACRARAVVVGRRVDHKRIGILYLVTTFVFFLVGGVEALFIHLQLAVPNNTFLEAETFNQLFTMHGIDGIPGRHARADRLRELFCAADDRRARDMAFPRLNAMSYWLLIFGGLLLLHFGVLTGADAGGELVRLCAVKRNTILLLLSVDYWVMALLILGVGSVAGAVNMIVTILTLRAPGMTFLRRVPLFVWMIFINSFLIIAAMPALNAAIVMLLIDRQLAAHFYLANQGGSPLLWQHFFWTFGHHGGLYYGAAGLWDDFRGDSRLLAETHFPDTASWPLRLWPLGC